MACIKRLNLGLHAKIGHHPAHRLQHARRVGHDIIGFRKIHRTAIKRANLRQTFRDMRDTLLGTCHIGPGLQRQRRTGSPEYHISAHTGGQVQHHIHIRIPNALSDLAVKCQIAGRLTGGRVAHMAMHNRSPRARR